MRRRIASICLLSVLLIGLVSAYSAQAAVVPPDDDPPPTSTPPNSTPAPDSDGDGVPNAVDQCPNEHGTQVTQGCPDRDWDGTRDSQDNCPNDPGPMWNGGCPIPIDNDGDGVPNLNDNCPYQPGPASNNGCPLPDADGDTIIDVVDNCPAIPNPDQSDLDWDDIGDVCDIDKDGDGITVEGGDMCPTYPGPRSNNGCPVVQRTCSYSAFWGSEQPIATITANISLGYGIADNGYIAVQSITINSIQAPGTYRLISSTQEPSIRGVAQYAWKVETSYEAIFRVGDRQNRYLVKLGCGEQLNFVSLSLNPSLVGNLNSATVELIAPTPTSTPTNTPSTPTVLALSDNVQIRSGDGLNYPMITRMSYNSTANILGRTSSGWLKVEYGGISGFIMISDSVRVNMDISNLPIITVSPTPTPTPVSPTPPPIGSAITYSGTCRENLQEDLMNLSTQAVDSILASMNFPVTFSLPVIGQINIHFLDIPEWVTGIDLSFLLSAFRGIVRPVADYLYADLVVNYRITYTYDGQNIVVSNNNVSVGDNDIRITGFTIGLEEENYEIGNFATNSDNYSFEYSARGIRFDLPVTGGVSLMGINFSIAPTLNITLDDITKDCVIPKETLINWWNQNRRG